jgi:AcrR family transcriptional regulator
VRRTRRAIEQAFVALVLERGYEQVGVDDIAARADVARPTFYTHYANKNDLFTAVFTRLIEDLKGLTFRTQSHTAVRSELVEGLYRHADQFRDLYRVCLSGAGDGRARDAYVDLLTEVAERNFSERIAGLGTTPRVPVHLMARALAGAHVVILRAWLEGEIDMPVEQLASISLNLLVAGWAWGHGISVADIELASRQDPEAEASRE